jgi:endoglycosylceramidase
VASMLRRLPAAGLVTILTVLAGSTSGATAHATPPAAAATTVRADSPFLRDAKGRVVFFHGVNAAWKLPPYYPPSETFGDQKSYFDQGDAEFLADAGLTHIRLGVFFAGSCRNEGGSTGATSTTSRASWTCWAGTG